MAARVIAPPHAPTGTADSAKAGTPPKRTFVPIRPAFRPLLPKPQTRESSEGPTIHIHTRASLEAATKKRAASRTDAIKRRRSNPLQQTTSNQGSGYSPQPKGSRRRTVSNDGAAISPSSLASGRSTGDVLGALSTPASKPLPMGQSSSAGTPSSYDDAGTPATPTSISESPVSVDTMSLFGSAPVTIDPMNISMEGNEFDIGLLPLDSAGVTDLLDAGSISAEPAPVAVSNNSVSMESTAVASSPSLVTRSDNAEATDLNRGGALTPPETQKAPMFAPFAPEAAAPFDELSEFYAIESSETTPEDATGGELAKDNFAKEDDFSIMEFLAPSVDLF